MTNDEGGRQRLFSGMQPTGDFHVGNYLGAVRNWVELQAQYDAIYCVVDLHALTVPYEPSELADRIGVSRQILSNHLACLRGCGLVSTCPEGRRTRYELSDPRIAHALDELLGIVLVVDPAWCPVAEDQDCC